MRRRALLLAATVLVAGACGGGGGLEGVTTDKAPAPQAPEVATNLPVPGAVATHAPPRLPERDPGLPTDTWSLEDLHRQGRTDVVR